MNVDLIRTLAKSKGLSLTKLEEILGFGNGTIGKWTKQSPSCDKLAAVANYLSVSLDYLYYGDASKACLNEHEENIIKSYRKNTSMQQAVDRLLGLDKVNVYKSFIAASSADNREATIRNIADLSTIPESNDEI